ncbi:MAG: hypothetical protein N2110_07400, partial [Flavobacteriales bacterium]|nr:hypothetical protein [Flavobacteriales bacterium]
MKNTFPFFFFRFLTLVVLWQGAGLVFSQTTLISPTVNNGGFESGLTSWTKVDATGLNRWYVSGVSGPFAGSNAAFISNTGGTTYTYDNTSVSTSHLYQDVAVPAGETVGTLTFQLKGNGESGWDRLLVYVAPTSVTPAPNVPASSSTTLTGATLVYTQTTFPISTYTLQTVSIDLSAYAGSTVRLIFTWQNDGILGTDPPASIDNITFTSAAPVTYTATALGGLWNSPATWVGGVVPPPFNDVVIPAGSVVICNQVLNYRDITVNGRLQFTTVTTSAPIHTVTRDLIVGPTGFLYCSNAAASLNQINIGRDLINNGTINAVTGVFAFNGNGNSQITG